MTGTRTNSQTKIATDVFNPQFAEAELQHDDKQPALPIWRPLSGKVLGLFKISHEAHKGMYPSSHKQPKLRRNYCQTSREL